MTSPRTSPTLLTPLQRLDLFEERSAALHECRLLRDGQLRAHLNVHFENDIWTVTADEPDEDDFRSYLLGIRLFIASGEPTHLGGIFNILELHLTDDELRGIARAARSEWKIAKNEGVGSA